MASMATSAPRVTIGGRSPLASSGQVSGPPAASTSLTSWHGAMAIPTSRCRVATPPPESSPTFWGLFAARGDVGPAGAPGAVGLPGQRVRRVKEESLVSRVSGPAGI